MSGSDPLMLFLLTSSTRRLFMMLYCDGNDPEILLSVRISLASCCDSSEYSIGSDPVNLFPLRSLMIATPIKTTRLGICKVRVL